MRSNDSAPRPPPSLPPSHQQVVSLSLSSCLSPVKLTYWREGAGEGPGVEPNQKTTRKPVLYESFNTLSLSYKYTRLVYFFLQDLELWGGDFYTDEMDCLLSTIGAQLNRSLCKRVQPMIQFIKKSVCWVVRAEQLSNWCTVKKRLAIFLSPAGMSLTIGVRSSKFIWAPVFSCTDWLRPRNPISSPSIWAHIRGRYWSAKMCRRHLYV